LNRSPTVADQEHFGVAPRRPSRPPPGSVALSQQPALHAMPSGQQQANTHLSAPTYPRQYLLPAVNPCRDRVALARLLMRCSRLAARVIAETASNAQVTL